VIYLSGVLEVELKSGKHALVVAAWLDQNTVDVPGVPRFLAFDPETHEPLDFSLSMIKKINSVLVR